MIKPTKLISWNYQKNKSLKLKKTLGVLLASLCVSCHYETKQGSSGNVKSESTNLDKIPDYFLAKKIASELRLPNVQLRKKNLSESVTIVNKLIDKELVGMGFDPNDFEVLNESRTESVVNCSLENVSIRTLAIVISEQISVSYRFTPNGIIFFDSFYGGIPD